METSDSAYRILTPSKSLTYCRHAQRRQDGVNKNKMVDVYGFLTPFRAPTYWHTQNSSVKVKQMETIGLN